MIEVSFEQKVPKSLAKLGSGFSSKHFRKTGASLLRSSEFAPYTQHYLGHSPSNTADSHYVKPNDDQFLKALEWLGDACKGSDKS